MTRKVFLRPDKKTTGRLNRMMGWSRWIYNQAVAIINREMKRRKWRSRKINVSELRRLLTTENSVKEIKSFNGMAVPKFIHKPVELFNILPADARQSMIDQVVTAYDNAMNKNRKTGRFSCTGLEFRRKKDHKDVFQLPGRNFKLIEKNRKGGKKSHFLVIPKATPTPGNKIDGLVGKVEIEIRDKTLIRNWKKWSATKKAFKIKYDGVRFCLLLPVLRNDKTLPSTNNVVGVDPGVRSICVTCNRNQTNDYQTDRRELHKTQKRVDKLAKKYTHVRTEHNMCLKRQEHQKASTFGSGMEKSRLQYQNALMKLDSQIQMAHVMIAKQIAQSNDIVIIGNLKTHELLENRKTNRRIRRDIQELRHYKFRQRLEQECDKYGRIFVSINEAYTSKTCSRCGFYKQDLGAAEIYECAECKLRCGRDENGANNIRNKILVPVWED